MSRKYKFKDNSKLYFISFATVYWIDQFIRKEYRDIVVSSIDYCQRKKGLEVYGWCIMTSHVHMIIGSPANLMSNIMRDLKRHSSEKLHRAITENTKESRREVILWLMKRAAAKTSNKTDFQLWQPENHPIELFSPKISHQKLDYLHYNPVEAGFVMRPTEWVYSSAGDYSGKKGLLNVLLLDPMMI